MWSDTNRSFVNSISYTLSKESPHNHMLIAVPNKIRILPLIQKQGAPPPVKQRSLFRRFWLRLIQFIRKEVLSAVCLITLPALNDTEQQFHIRPYSQSEECSVRRPESGIRSILSHSCCGTALVCTSRRRMELRPDKSGLTRYSIPLTSPDRSQTEWSESARQHGRSYTLSLIHNLRYRRKAKWKKQ